MKNPALSVGDAAVKMDISLGSMTKIRKMVGIRSKVKVQVPKISKQQIESAKGNCRKLYKRSVPSGGNFFFVMEDETYMQLDPQEAKRKQYVSIVPGHQLPQEARISQKSKFPSKMLVWQAITEDGRVSPAFVMKGTMDGDIYRKKCLQDILKPWLQSLNVQQPILFWPDKASIHYARITIDFLKDNKIEYVSKLDNPTSVPQIRPIERFWELCKRQMKKEGKISSNLAHFKRRWTTVSKRIAEKLGKRLFQNFRKKLRLAGSEGPWAVSLKKM